MPDSIRRPFVPVLAAALALLAAGACQSAPASNGAKTSAASKSEDLKDTGTYVSQFRLPGKRVYVELYEPAQNRVCALINRGAAVPADVNALQAPEAGRPEKFLKVATDAHMADFCENLRRLGFYEISATSDARATDDKRWVMKLDVDGSQRFLRYTPSAGIEIAKKSNDLKLVFFALFNETLALRNVNNPDGTSFFDKENKKAAQAAPQKK